MGMISAEVSPALVGPGTKCPPGTSAYARALSAAPALLARLEDAAKRDLRLQDEVALARAMLDEIVGKFALAYEQSEGKLDPAAYVAVVAQLRQVQSLVQSAAEIDARRDDQTLSAAHVFALLGGLRDELKRALRAAFHDIEGERAAGLVDSAFQNARWTAGRPATRDR